MKAHNCKDSNTVAFYYSSNSLNIYNKNNIFAKLTLNTFTENVVQKL